MGYVYAYAPDADDFDCLGLVGALTPVSCVQEEIAGGSDEVTLVHPLDEEGRWRALGVATSSNAQCRCAPRRRSMEAGS